MGVFCELKTLTFNLIILILISHATGQIICGIPASPGEFKYEVSILYLTYHTCGGAIIDPMHVVTAAHCVYDRKKEYLEIYAGAVQLYDENGIHKSIEKIVIHPFYYDENETLLYSGHQYYASNDIAVLTIDSPFELKENIEIIELPTRNLRYCQQCYFAGWGVTEKNGNHTSTELQWTTLSVLNPDSCEERKSYHRTDEFCAFDMLGVSTACNGDSGSPMACNGKLIGINVIGNSEIREPTIFTNVYYHLEFIKEAQRNLTS